MLQVFDSGLIGEGVLHLLFAAKHKLLQPDASLTPISATVYCQPIQVAAGAACAAPAERQLQYRAACVCDWASASGAYPSRRHVLAAVCAPHVGFQIRLLQRDMKGCSTA